MIISSTGAAYLILFLAISFLTYRFFQYWLKNRDITSKYFLYFAVLMDIFALVRAVTGLFFANNTQILISSAVFATFIHGSVAAVCAYLIIHLNFPRVSPKIGFYAILFLALATTILYAILKPAHPYLESNGAINWGLSPATGPYLYFYILRFGLHLITFVPLLIILIRQFRASNVFYLKMRALGFSLVFFFGIITSLLDFFLIKILKFNAFGRDIVTGILGIILFVVIFITQKPNQPIQDF